MRAERASQTIRTTCGICEPLCDANRVPAHASRSVRHQGCPGVEQLADIPQAPPVVGAHDPDPNAMRRLVRPPQGDGRCWALLRRRLHECGELIARLQRQVLAYRCAVYRWTQRLEDVVTI
eukprot:4541397-Prymnesium_polylepis.2